jgi:hypothetical protein
VEEERWLKEELKLAEEAVAIQTKLDAAVAER